MFGVKWVLVVIILVFGGLYSYQNFFKVDQEPVQTRVSEEIGVLSMRVKAASFKPAKVKDAKNYLIFVGKSSNPESVELANQMVKFHQEKVKGGTELEVIHYNLDNSKQAAQQWAQKAKFPWPILLHSNERVKEANLVIKEHFEKKIPQLILIDKNGEFLSSSNKLEELLENVDLDLD